MSENTPEETPAEEPTDSGEDFKPDGHDDPSVISDDQLPEDLQPRPDNPLAQAPDESDEDEGLSIGAEAPPAP